MAAQLFILDLVTKINWKKVGNIALVSGVIVGTGLTIRKVVRATRRSGLIQQAGTANNPTTFATMLKQAFENDTWFGAGTDEESVYSTLNLITTRRLWSDVQKSYKILYNEELIDQLGDELQTSELRKAYDIINNYQ